MATKYTLQSLEGDNLVTKSKKEAAIKFATEQNLSEFRIVTDKGTVVYEQVPEYPAEPVEVEEAPEPQPTEAEETVYHVAVELPGNYSIVSAPGALMIAEAVGIPARSESFSNTVMRKVHFGGDSALAHATADRVTETLAEALEILKDWQKETREKRRGQTDMQKFIGNREVIAAHFKKVARKIAKDGL